MRDITAIFLGLCLCAAGPGAAAAAPPAAAVPGQAAERPAPEQPAPEPPPPAPAITGAPPRDAGRQGAAEDRARLWAAAVALMRGGRPRAALPYLERLVTVDPADPRLRVELALALFQVEDDERARFQFEQALAGGLPSSVTERIERHLAAIDARRAWQASFTFSLVPESNAARRTGARTITIGGARFVLDPDARAKSGTGVHLGGSAAYVPRLARDLRLRLGLAASGRLFRDEDLNDVAVRAEAGLLYLRDGGTEWGAGASVQRRWVGGSGFSQAPGAYLGYATRLDPVTRLAVRADLERYDHDAHPGLDGPRLRLNATLARAQSPQLVLRSRAFATRTSADAAHESGTEAGFGLGASYAFAGGLTPSLDVTYARALRDERSPLFAQRRSEERLEIAATFLHRPLHFRGFAPTLEIAHEIRRANIALYDYETTRVSIGVTRRF